MEALTDIARVYNILEAKLEHSSVPLSLKDFCDMAELAGHKETQVRDCLRSLVSKGKAYRTPIFRGRDRIGYTRCEEQPVPGFTAPSKKPVEVKPKEEIRLRVNPDKTVTIVTTHFNITIEVPK